MATAKKAPSKPSFPEGPTNVEEAEHYTTILMRYIIKHPERSISETLSVAALPPSATNTELMAKLHELMEAVE